YGLYAIDCHKVNKPAVKFVFAGEPFAIRPSHYIIPVGRGRCVSAFAASTSPDLSRWVLGNTFLRAWHTTFDVEKFEIKLARAVQPDDEHEEQSAGAAQPHSSVSAPAADKAAVDSQLKRIIEALATVHPSDQQTTAAGHTKASAAVTSHARAAPTSHARVAPTSHAKTTLAPKSKDGHSHDSTARKTPAAAAATTAASTNTPDAAAAAANAGGVPTSLPIHHHQGSR
ncbi:hypothetical protein LPJ61_000486, partial [Coemansia biformis]